MAMEQRPLEEVTLMTIMMTVMTAMMELEQELEVTIHITMMKNLVLQRRHLPAMVYPILNLSQLVMGYLK